MRTRTRQYTRSGTPRPRGARAADRRAIAAIATASATAVAVLDVREGLGLSRSKFARLSGYSERAVAAWEGGRPQSASTHQRMTELARLKDALREVVGGDADQLGRWFDTPNPAFDGLKPLEVAERGHADRLWRMVYHLQAGEPV